MRFTASILGIALIIAIALPAWAQEKYGDAILEKGTLTVVRGGQNLKFSKAPESIPVFVDDLLRVGEDSSVSLKTREKSTINMGANAVFQVKPFQFQEKQGFARLLFGRFRSVVSGLTGGESMNTKTATAVIGVKGTENLAAIRPRGDTMLIGVKDRTSVQSAARASNRVVYFGRQRFEIEADVAPVRAGGGSEEADFILIPSTPDSGVQARRVADGGDGVGVDPNTVTLVIGDNPPTPPAPVPPEVLQEFKGGNLNSPPAESDQASTFPGQDGLVKAGITSQESLDEGQSADIEAGGAGPGGDLKPAETPKVETPNLSEGQQNLFRGNVTPSFKRK